MTTINASSLVKGGKMTKHPARFLFKAYLRGRKPSLILAFEFLSKGEGLFVTLQAELRTRSCLTPQTASHPSRPVLFPTPSTPKRLRSAKRDIAIAQHEDCLTNGVVVVEHNGFLYVVYGKEVYHGFDDYEGGDL